jgi:hypothetical protein
MTHLGIDGTVHWVFEGQLGRNPNHPTRQHGTDPGPLALASGIPAGYSTADTN